MMYTKGGPEIPEKRFGEQFDNVQINIKWRL